MKIRSGPDARVMAHVVSHYRHACYQSANATGTRPCFGVSRDERIVNVINIAGDGARRSKLVGKGKKLVRRVTY